MKRGEIWLVTLDPTIGAEIKKTRPAVIVNDDSVGTLPLRVVVPITNWQPRRDDLPWAVRLHTDPQNGLDKVSIADCFQVRSLSQQRFVRRLGWLSSNVMDEISDTLAIVLSIKLQ